MVLPYVNSLRQGTDDSNRPLQPPPKLRISDMSGGYGEQVAAIYEKAINRFYLAQRLASDAGVSQDMRKEMALPNLIIKNVRDGREVGQVELSEISLTFTSSFGDESVDLKIGKAKPSGEAPAAKGRKRNIIVANSVTIDTPFKGWPVPASQFDGGNPEHWTMYAYNPFFYPGNTTGRYGGIVFGAGKSADSEIDDFVYDPEDGTLKWATVRMGCQDIAASFRSKRRVVGRQYWEVEIIQLPSAVPPMYQPEVMDPPPGPQYVLGWQFVNGVWIKGIEGPLVCIPFSNLEGHASGLICGIGPPHYGNLWLEEVSPCSYYTYRDWPYNGTRWPSSLNTFLNPVIGLWPDCETFTRSSVIGLDDPAAIYRSIGVARTSVLRGDYRALPYQRWEWDGSAWSLIDIPAEHTTLLWGDLWRAPDIDTGHDGAFPMYRYNYANWSDQHPENRTKGDCAFLGDGGVMLPFGAVPPGDGETIYNSLVFKGRGDSLRSIKSPGEAESEINSGGGADGIWTGVALGELREGDIVMIATDTKTRKVWFGKNGHWIGPGGTLADPSKGSGFACLMDGEAGARNYFPAVSFRLGPTKLRMRFAGAQKFAAPSGFEAFDAEVIEIQEEN